MGNFELLQFEGPGALAKSAAEKLLRFLSVQHPATLCLSGGRIALSLFAELRAHCQDKTPGARELVESTEFFWADERCVPASDPESNFGIAQQRLFAPLQVRAERIHRIPGEADPLFSAKMAEAELCRFAPLNSDGTPMIDLLLLGMGEDGHLASLFPGQLPEIRWVEAVYYPVIGPKPPPARITISHKAIVAAKEVWILISGDGKKSVFARALAKEPSIPLGRVLRDRERTLIFSDL